MSRYTLFESSGHLGERELLIEGVRARIELLRARSYAEPREKQIAESEEVVLKQALSALTSVPEPGQDALQQLKDLASEERKKKNNYTSTMGAIGSLRRWVTAESDTAGLIGKVIRYLDRPAPCPTMRLSAGGAGLATPLLSRGQ